jgi:chemotaxis signal transduction protein
MIITQSRNHTVAIVVDEVDDVVEMPSGCLQDAPQMHALSAKMIGVCRLGDALVYLLDIDKLLGLDVLDGKG